MMELCLLAVIYLSFISLGLPDSLLGSAWPMIRVDFQVPISYMGFASMIISGGTVVSALLSERMILKWKTKTVTIVSVFLTAAALMGFSRSTSFIELCLWAIPYGLGAGSIDAALNHYVALHYHAKHMSWLHCFWGLGTMISPYIMSYACMHSVWSDGYRAVAYLQLGIAAVLVLTIPLWRVHRETAQKEEKVKPLGISGALKIKGVVYILIGFLAYCGAEATTMLWASSYLEVIRGATKEEAAAFGALFFIGITVGRFLSGFITEKLGDDRMIFCGISLAVLGVLCIVLPFKLTSMIGFVVIGLGCAPVYPCLIHATPHKFGAENAQAIIGIQMAAAYIGSTFAPPIFGWMANHIGLTLMPIYLAAFFAVLFWMMTKAQKCGRDTENIR